MRRDLLEDPDWLASAVLRHFSAIVGPGTSLNIAREKLTPTQVLQVIEAILSGLGYRTSQRGGQARDEGEMAIMAWPPVATDDLPAVQVEVNVASQVGRRQEDESQLYQLFGDSTRARSGCLYRSPSRSAGTDFNWEEEPGDEGAARDYPFVFRAYFLAPSGHRERGAGA